MSQLVGKSAEDCKRGHGDAGLPHWYQEQDCSRGAGRGLHRRAKAHWTESAARGACGNTVGQAKVIVREDTTENGAWAWIRPRERFRWDSDATSFTEVFQCSWSREEKSFEDVWREWVKKISKLPQGPLSSQALEQLTISGLRRHDQPELENHLRFRAPLAWKDVQIRVDNISPQSTGQQSPQPTDISALWWQVQSVRAAEVRHIKGRIAGTKMRLANIWKPSTLDKGMSKWKRRRETGAPRALTDVQVKTQAKAKTRRNTMQMTLVQKSLSKEFGVWLFKTLTKMKVKVFPGHRDGSKFQKSHHEHRDGSKFGKSHHEHRDGSKFGKSHHEHRDGAKFWQCHEKTSRRIKIQKSGREDRDGRTGLRRRTKNKTWKNSCRAS